MPTLTVTAEGQVTLEKELLEHLGAKPGDRINAEKLPGGRLEVTIAKPTGQLSDVFGLLKHKTSLKLSIEDINRIAAEGWAGKR